MGKWVDGDAAVRLRQPQEIENIGLPLSKNEKERLEMDEHDQKNESFTAKMVAEAEKLRKKEGTKRSLEPTVQTELIPGLNELSNDIAEKLKNPETVHRYDGIIKMMGYEVVIEKLSIRKVGVV